MRTRRREVPADHHGTPAKRQRGSGSGPCCAATPTATAEPEPAAPAALGSSPFVVVAAVADTHGVLDPKLLEQLREAAPSYLLHMGDIGDPARKSRLDGTGVLQQLAALPDSSSPPPTVHAVAGNVDEPDKELMATGLPHIASVEVAGWRLLLTHGHAPGLEINVRGVMDRLRGEVDSRCANVVLFGHSHVPLVAYDGAASPPQPITPNEEGNMWSVSRLSSSGEENPTLLINPGSAGPRRFKLPRCWFLLRSVLKQRAFSWVLGCLYHI